MVTTSRRACIGADGEQRAIAADSQRYRREPARSGAVSPHSSRGRLGRHRLGVPRADVERALSPVPRRHRRSRSRTTRSAPNGSSAAKRESQWRPSPNVTLRTTWFHNRVKDPVSNVTLSQVGQNVTQQRQNLGKTRIRGLQSDVEYPYRDGLESVGRLRVQPGQSHRQPVEPCAHRQVAAAGACASRLDPGCIFESEDPYPRRGRAVCRLAIRR